MASVVVVPPAAGASISRVLLDFGSVGQTEAIATIADSAVHEASKVLGAISGISPPGRSDGDVSMDSYFLQFTPDDGSFQVQVTAFAGLVYGQYYLDYTVG